MAHRLGVIGGGNMGAAIVRGIVAAKIFRPGEIIVAEIDPAKRNALADLGCDTSANAAEAARAGLVLLAVKPQVFPQIAEAVRPVDDGQVVISIMAGLNTGTIHAALGGGRMVRAMPNVACQIGKGMTAIALGTGARQQDGEDAASIFAALGKTVIVEEALMHAVTAVSGSGPAYVFLLAEAMEKAARQLGFDAATARLLVSQTVLGAGALLSESESTAAELRQSVTSPGGTTAAALDVFARHDFVQTVIDALTAARDRGRALDRA